MGCAWSRLAGRSGGLGIGGIQDAEGTAVWGEHLRSIDVHCRTVAAHAGRVCCDSHAGAGGNARGSCGDAARGVTVDGSIVAKNAVTTPNENCLGRGIMLEAKVVSQFHPQCCQCHSRGTSRHQPFAGILCDGRFHCFRIASCSIRTSTSILPKCA
jgi:hypothetical protein